MLLLSDDLEQDRTGDVFLALFVDHDEIDFFHHEATDVRERDVPTLNRVVETTIRVLLDDSRLAHGCSSWQLGARHRSYVKVGHGNPSLWAMPNSSLIDRRVKQA